MSRRKFPDPPSGEPRDPAPEFDGPSKSQLKREMHALQALGSQLAEVSKEAFKKLPLPESLEDALREARRITDHEGRRRQMQYVGKVMRSLSDEEIEALRRVLDAINGVSRAETARLHAIERERDALMADDAALTDFMRRHPGAQVQQGRNLIRQARREASQGRPPRAYRELFQWVKTVKAEAEGGQSARAGDPGDSAHEDAPPGDAA